MSIELELTSREAARLNSTILLINSLAPEAQILKDQSTMKHLLGVAYWGGDGNPRALYDANALIQQGFTVEELAASNIAVAITNNKGIDTLVNTIYENPIAAAQVVDELAATEQGTTLLPMLMLVKSILLGIEEQDNLDAMAAVMMRLISKRGEIPEPVEEVQQ